MFQEVDRLNFEMGRINFENELRKFEKCSESPMFVRPKNWLETPTVKIKIKDLEFHSRSKILFKGTYFVKVEYDVIKQLFRKFYSGRQLGIMRALFM